MTTVTTTTVYCDRCNARQIAAGHPSGNGWFLGTPWSAVNAGWGRWVGGYLHLCPACLLVVNTERVADFAEYRRGVVARALDRAAKRMAAREAKATRRKGPRLPLGGAS